MWGQEVDKICGREYLSTDYADKERWGDKRRRLTD